MLPDFERLNIEELPERIQGRKRVYVPVNECIGIERWDSAAGKTAIIHLGSYINHVREVNGKMSLVHSKNEVVAATALDLCERKSSLSRYKWGVSKDGWHLGIKDSHDGIQHLYRFAGVGGMELNRDGRHEVNGFVPANLLYAFVDSDCYLQNIHPFVKIKFEGNPGGVGVKHIFEPSKIVKEWGKSTYICFKWYVNSLTDISIIAPDINTEFATGKDEGGEYFLEYFKTANLYDDDKVALKGEISNLYETIPAPLTADLVLHGGATYYIENTVNLGDYDITRTGDGDIFVKYAAGKYLSVNGSGKIDIIGIDNNQKTIFTSMNDDVHGDYILGSSGAPAMGDIANLATTLVPGTPAANPRGIRIERFEVWYFGNGSNNVITCYGAYDASGNKGSYITLRYGEFFYCYGTANRPLIGSAFGADKDNDQPKIIDSIKVDLTNDVSQFATNYSAHDGAGMTISNCSYVSVFTTGGYGIYAVNSDLEISNTYILYAVGGLVNNRMIYHRLTGSTAVSRSCTIKQSTIVGASGADDLDYATRFRTDTAAHTLAIEIKDCLWECSTVTAPFVLYRDLAAGTITTDLDYCLFYCPGETDTNFIGGVGSHSISTAASGATNRSGDPVSSVRDDSNIEYPAYEIATKLSRRNLGSDTYTNLGIDNTYRSATGYRDNESDNITPGVQYPWIKFKNRNAGVVIRNLGMGMTSRVF